MRLLKEFGIAPDTAYPDPSPDTPAPLPRLAAKRPRIGHRHPATKADIARVLRFFGEQYTYGLRAVELARGERDGCDDTLVMGRLVVPGTIILYDQKPSPWVMPRGHGLSPTALARLRRAGATIASSSVEGPVTVSWPEETLRDYMLFDVLMHEIGHHLIQQYTGKRQARVARTRDHEAFADRFARRCRQLYTNGGACP